MGGKIIFWLKFRAVIEWAINVEDMNLKSAALNRKARDGRFEMRLFFSSLF